MNDQTGPTPTEPIAPIEASLAGSSGFDVPQTPPAVDPPAAAFSGRTPRKIDALRAGMIVGTGLVFAMGAAIAMGASPSPAPTTDGGGKTVPGPATVPGGGGRGFGIFGPGGFGPFGGFGGFGGFGPIGPGGPRVVPGFGPGPSVRGFGQVSVTEISGSSVSLRTDDGWTRTITVTDATKITKGGAAATLADLKVGDVVRLAETRNADGSYTITALGIVLPQVAGTVTAVGADTITITLRDGTSQAIKTTGSTAYQVEGQAGHRADVSVGTTIVATGERGADGSLTATSVWVRLPRVVGSVTATTADTITLARRDGTTVKIHVGSGTTIRVAGVSGAKLSDITAGMIVVAEGTQRSDGSIDARAIGAGRLGKGLGRDRLPGSAPGGSSAPDSSGGTTG